MTNRTADRTCGFCGKEVEGVGRYIYPVPGDPSTRDNRVGKLACARCWPEQYRLQAEQGLAQADVRRHEA